MRKIPPMQDATLIYFEGQAEITVPTRKLENLKSMMSAAGYAVGEGQDIANGSDDPVNASFTIMYDPEQEPTFIEHLQVACLRNDLNLKIQDLPQIQDPEE